MDIEEKKDLIFDAIQGLNWNDDKIPEVMDGFFNSPLDAIEKSDGEMSEDHIENLFGLFDLEDNKEDEE